MMIPAETLKMIEAEHADRLAAMQARVEAAEIVEREAAVSSIEAWTQRNAIYAELLKVQARAEAAEAEIDHLKTQLGDPHGVIDHADAITRMSDKANAEGDTALARAEAAEKREAVLVARITTWLDQKRDDCGYWDDDITYFRAALEVKP